MEERKVKKEEKENIITGRKAKQKQPFCYCSAECGTRHKSMRLSLVLFLLFISQTNNTETLTHKMSNCDDDPVYIKSEG